MIFLSTRTIKEKMQRYSSVKEINSSAIVSPLVAINEQKI